MKAHQTFNTVRTESRALLPLIFIGGLALLWFFPQVTANTTLQLTLVSTIIILSGWHGILIARKLPLSVAISVRPQHYVQACAQGSVLLYWGWYWREVYDSAYLLLAQILFAYAFDFLLSWSKRHSYALGFAPVPVIFSINLFLWFKPDWFYFQFLLIALGFLAKDFIRWKKDGRSAHIFNPSSFPLGVFSLCLILTGTTDLTWGQEIATTLNNAPQIYLFIFLISLPGQLLFGVTTMTMAAVITMYLFGLIYFATIGTFYFYDAYIPIAVFLGMHLLFTDPSTAPRSELGRILFGVAYSLSVIVLYGTLNALGFPRFYDKLLAVPLMNLGIQSIDWFARSQYAQYIDPSNLLRILKGKRRNLGYISVWTVIFVLMSANQGVGDTHRGHWITFWKQACTENLRNGCRHYGILTSSYCNRGSGWACNEYGILLQPQLRPELARQAFQKACDFDFSAGCSNREDDNLRKPLEQEPSLADYKIIVRQGKNPLPTLSQLHIYQEACIQGFSDACEQACTLGDQKACDLSSE